MALRQEPLPDRNICFNNLGEWGMGVSAVTERRKSIAVKVGSVSIGGDHPIAVQSMTNTDTADAEATSRQVAELHEAGSELVRITVDRPEAAAAVPHIRDR